LQDKIVSPERIEAPRLVIVNADDWGYDRVSTDRALECLQAGRITSASAMVHMADSERAAAIGSDIPALGLHLNLTEPYAAGTASEPVRERQRAAAGYFTRWRGMRWLYNPLIRSAVRGAVQDQLEAFQELYGRPPSHVDSHHHVHVSPNVLFDGGIPAGMRVRRSYTFLPGQKGSVNLAVRRAMNGFLVRRYTTTDYFFDVTAAADLRELPDLPASTVELMAHPAWEEEYEFLTGDGWGKLLSGWRLGSYRDL
jgi:chitin disaccharide deacetylase